MFSVRYVLRSVKLFYISLCDVGPEIEEKIERRVMSMIALKRRDIDITRYRLRKPPLIIS